MFGDIAQIAQGAEHIRIVHRDEVGAEVEVTLSGAQLAQWDTNLRAAHALFQGSPAQL